MNKQTIIIGNGGHASVLTEILLAQSINIIGFTAPQREQNNFNLPYLGTDDVVQNYQPAEIELVLGVGMIRPSPLRKKSFITFKK